MTDKRLFSLLIFISCSLSAQIKGIVLDSLTQAPIPFVNIWVENESRSIGRIFIPPGFWEPMKRSPLFHIAIPYEARMDNLLADYVLEHTEELRVAFKKIDSKLGGLRFKNAIEALDKGDFRAAAAIALEYYDKTYQHCLDTNIAPEIHHLTFDHGNPVAIAQALMAQA